MINDNTIISSFNDKPTLLEWLKKVEEALKTDTATGVSVENPSVNNYIFKITFADGKAIASETIKFPDSVNGVSITNNHLIITTQGGIREDLGVINPYADTIVLNSQTNTTEIGNNLKVNGNVQLGQQLNVTGVANFNGNANFNGGSINVDEDLYLGDSYSLDFSGGGTITDHWGEKGNANPNKVLGTDEDGHIVYKDIIGGSLWKKHIIALADGVIMVLLTTIQDTLRYGEIDDGKYPAILLDISGSSVPQPEYTFPVLIKQGNKFKLGNISSNNQRSLYTFDKTLITSEEIADL